MANSLERPLFTPQGCLNLLLAPRTLVTLKGIPPLLVMCCTLLLFAGGWSSFWLSLVSLIPFLPIFFGVGRKAIAEQYIGMAA